VRRWKVWLSLVAALVVAAAAASMRPRPPAEPDRSPVPSRSEWIRQVLFNELEPVPLKNCEVERFGEPRDGGYVMCANLLQGVQATYSYGIGGYDGWGCAVSRRLGVPVHQYDCFNTRRPACPGGEPVFHEECVAGEPFVEDGRTFDTMQRQIDRNGDTGRQLAVKIDVEGAEWDAFLRAPRSVFESIDQLAVEFHGVDEERFVLAVWTLKEHFYVAHRHFNNFACSDGLEPFPAWAFEVLFVSKRLGVPAPPGTPAGFPALDAANNPQVEDCQASVRR